MDIEGGFVPPPGSEAAAAEAEALELVTTEPPEYTAPYVVPISIAELDREFPLNERAAAYWQESKMHSSFVLVFILVVVAVSDGITLGLDTLPGGAKLAFLFILHGECLMALICYFYILLGDPGDVHRSEKRCFPIPDEVQDWMRRAKCPNSGRVALEPLKENFWGHDKKGPCPTEPCKKHTYCVRCMVWRPVKAHHCRTCQRCVTGFDHHCGVFGRCIAGEACGEGTPDPPGVTPGTGNIKYFQWILWCGGLATLLNIIFFVVSFATN
eukprot:TRINITY_DN6135_c0_g1_i1.p2 TRINITY_DN6135_c0_g1~~TRINITY_DN6135_c0_g1_i1.p2  ORF type:complete len:269 (-),score=50.37 TRINITY_DN6135_c0_g1_i1:121-927(-)